ncbi:neuromodulin isoform X2 [Spea bombifrons]|uniref:neuromodulin isoform X2 n=1 Tax=Spea bombifrons TaxID=233779 RepID=UPI0023494A95|nr:neuromodulin isoform X2 [Spea bombifrons]
MLCCMRRTKQVEKNEDGDQKIEQDANKPEDKAHKAATKIQASFRGHIIRKKLKGGDKKGDENTGEAVENHKDDAKEEPGKTENEASKTEEPTADGPLSEDDKKKAESSAAEDKKEAASEEEAKNTEKSQNTPSEEKHASGETESTTKGTTENSSGNDSNQVKDESKQADVPASNQETAPAKDQETADSSQGEEKKGGPAAST